MTLPTVLGIYAIFVMAWLQLGLALSSMLGTAAPVGPLVLLAGFLVLATSRR